MGRKNGNKPLALGTALLYFIDHGYDVLQTSDGGYIIAGDTMGTNRENMNFLVIKTDANGNKQWEKAYGDDSYSAAEQAYSIDATNDGGFIIAGGKSAWDFYLIKIDSEGMNNSELKRTAEFLKVGIRRIQ